jgi:hypothetical protein
MSRLCLRFLRSRKFWQRSAFAVGCLITLLTLAILVENWRGRRAWEQYRKDAEVRGVQYEWAAFIPTPIPEEENFAATTFFRALTSRDRATRDNALGASLAHIRHLHLEPEPGAETPKSLRKVQLALAQAQLISHPSENAAEDILKFLDRFEPVLSEQRGALSREGGRLPSGWEKGIEADFFDFGDPFVLSPVLTVRIAALLEQGRREEAFTDWLVLFRSAELYREEPSLLAGMMRAMLMESIAEAAREGAITKEWKPAQLAEIESRLADVDLMADYRFAMDSERALITLTLRRLHEFPADQVPNGNLGKTILWLLPGWVDQNAVRIGRWHDSNTGGDLPQVRAEAGKAAHRNWFSQYYWALSDATIYALRDQGEVVRDAQSKVDLSRLLCAAARYQLREGTIPDNPVVLVPDFLPSIPEDAMSGQPFRYYRDGDALLIYSVGPDGKDDGGNGDDVAVRMNRMHASAE